MNVLFREYKFIKNIYIDIIRCIFIPKYIWIFLSYETLEFFSVWKIYYFFKNHHSTHVGVNLSNMRFYGNPIRFDSNGKFYGNGLNMRFDDRLNRRFYVRFYDVSSHHDTNTTSLSCHASC